MFYLTQAHDIKEAIDYLSTHQILWVDTETAFWDTPNPQLSLIQVLADKNDTTGESSYILDIFKYPSLCQYFILKIMANSKIKKVFHNANYDLRFLGNSQARNVICTLKMAREIGKKALGVSDLKLKTLAEELCHFTIEENEQASNWSQRPLSQKQLKYAMMDVVYLAHVHEYFLKFMDKILTRFDDEQQIEIYGLSPVNQQILEEYFPVLIENNGLEPISQPRLSINDIALAYECPRLFYLGYKASEYPEFIRDKQTQETNSIFRELIGKLTTLIETEVIGEGLFNLAQKTTNNQELAQKIKDLFYKNEIFNYLQRIKNDNNTLAMVYQTWTELTNLIELWSNIIIKNCNYCKSEELFKKTFVSNQENIEYSFTIGENKTQNILGFLINAVYLIENKTLYLVTEKLNQSEEKFGKKTRVALQSYLIHKKKDIEINSVVEMRWMGGEPRKYSWGEIEEIVAKIISEQIPRMQQWLTWNPPATNPPPVTSNRQLCQICPRERECKTLFDTTIRHEKPGKIVITHPPKEETEKIVKDLVAALKAFGVKINDEETEAIVAPAFIRVKIKPRLGVKVNAIINLSDDLQVQLGFQDTPLIQPQAGYVSIDIPRVDRQIARLENYIEKKPDSFDEPFKIAIGINLEGKLVEADLGDSNTCHFLVAGTTGSGKSEFLRALLLSLLLRHSPEKLKIVLVDPKRVTFPEFEKIPWLYSPIIKEGEPAIKLMADLVDEMENRYKILEKSQSNDLNTYNQRVGYPQNKALPRIVCIFDEYADFMADKETAKSLEESIKRLGAKARAAGIHLIIATQRPEAKVVTPLIRANLPGRVALKTASGADSAIILGDKQTDAFRLLGKGDLLYLMGAQLVRLQSLYAANFQL